MQRQSSNNQYSPRKRSITPQKKYTIQETQNDTNFSESAEMKYDFIPLSPKLIEHVRRLNSLNDDELEILRVLMTQAGQIIDKRFSFDETQLSKDSLMRRYLENTLKIHQIFALVDVDFEMVFSQKFENVDEDPEVRRVKDILTHFKAVEASLIQNKGLTYVPRDQTPDGRLFEHASDSRILIDHLATLHQKKLAEEQKRSQNSPRKRTGSGVRGVRDQFSTKPSQQSLSAAKNKSTEDIKDRNMAQFFIKLCDNLENGQVDESRDQDTQSNEQQVLKELKITEAHQIVMKLDRPFLNLSMKAKGKADLYFHAYFWQEYLKILNETQNYATNIRGPKMSSRDSDNTVTSVHMGTNIYDENPIVVDGESNQDLDSVQAVNSRDKSPAKGVLRQHTQKSQAAQNNTSGRRANEQKYDQKKTVSSDPLMPNFDKIDIYENGPTTQTFMKRLFGLASTMKKVIVNIKKFPFTAETYQKYILGFATEGQKYSNKKNKYLEEIQRALFVAQISDDQEALYLIEKLLIKLMGYCDIAVRDQAVVLLNMLYDEVDWQLQEAFRPVVRSVGQHFIINVIVQFDGRKYKQDPPEYFLCLAAPSPIQGNNQHIVTWHQINKSNILNQDDQAIQISINFGKFYKCGFFDWRLFEVSDVGKFIPCEIVGHPDPVFPIVNNEQEYDNYYEEDNTVNIAQGRFIVHARGMRDHTFHEVQIDYQNAQFDKNTNSFIKRGNFRDVEQKIDTYAKQGVSALYLMGTLARDNFQFQSSYSNNTEYRKDDASPMAVTTRDTANKMLGGDAGLKAIVQKAKSRNVKIIVDSLARVSSSRHHRKYKDLLLHYLNEDGRREICYGTDGQAQNFMDTAMLNYRKIEAWDMLIDEIITYAEKIDIDGIHLDNGQAWPQIMQPDVEELRRVDEDGEAAYSPDDFMDGNVVVRNENHGYWNTNIMETYPNPFFIKLAKKCWTKRPNFMIIGECWGGFMFENRQIILARSAVIPRLFKLPMTISSLFGKKLHKDGRIEKCQKENVVAIKKWYNETRKFLPEGTILLQSSTAHSLPYPAHLYGRGTWAAIDILYLMPDIPITFMGEIDGEVYNIGQQTIFQHEQTDVQEDKGVGMKRSNSRILMALTQKNEADKMLPTLMDESFSSTNQDTTAKGMTKVSSRINLSQLALEDSQMSGFQHITQQETNFKQELDPQMGYDLSQINSHYQHRRLLRQSKMVLRYGEVFYLSARENENVWHEDILAFARYSHMETIIIATNLSEKEKSFYIDASALMPTLRQAYSNNAVVQVKDCIREIEEPKYYFLREFLELRETQTLRPYRSSIMSLQIIMDDQYIFKKCLTTSIERMKRNLVTGDSIESEQISLLFTDCVEHNHLDIERFANIIGSIQTSFLDKLNVSFDKMYKFNYKLTSNAVLGSRLMAMCEKIVESSRGDQSCPAVRAAQQIASSNQLGEIVFATPELGRWSTVGGLGVMVDELSIGLVNLGQKCTVISPYYERNRKGQTGYLANDPAGIRFAMNLTVTVGGQTVTLGVHEGIERGVRVVFLHNGEVFPAPYQGGSASAVVFQIAVFNKACLEYCCQKRIKPSVCVTNDWFTGLMAGYRNARKFGDYFDGCKFLHICHNLQETYEGRIHPHNHEGDLNRIHDLPRDWFSDNGNMINPSKCAVMQSDTWATVSKSYREELLGGSSLAHLLKQKPNPFAFPNGIPISDRIKKLDAAAPDHLTAKKKIQQKYFNYQDLDDTCPLFAFVGRVTAQKGVHLILDIAEHIIQKFQHKVQILVGGPANMGEPYSAGCAHKMWHLKNKFPNNFYAAPEEFFTDGSLINRGADFGLMPSAFEPGGIVQHEFFVGKTPVIAFRTGGLKDSVIEFKWDSEEGSGFTFDHHNHHEMGQSIERAVNTFRNKEKYLKLRENAFRATMDGEIVCKAWLGEFCRLTENNFFDQKVIDNTKRQITKSWSSNMYQPVSIIKEIFGSEQRRELFCDIDQGATERMGSEKVASTTTGGTKIEDPFSPDRMMEIEQVMSAFDRVENSKKPQVFMLHNRGPRYSKVQICGSMDEWGKRHEMQFDTFTNQWYITLHLKIGEEYLYKYIINDQHWVVNDEEQQRKDNSGNLNNYCSVNKENHF